VNKTAKAFAPGAISSFFEIHDSENGQPITDLTKVGAIGGGFGLEKGTYTTVNAVEAKDNSLNVTINGQPVQAKTTKQVVETLLSYTNKKYALSIDHRIELPIGMGFGTSAGGALTTGLALKQALSLPLTYNQIGQVAHVAEIQCVTGLGTVSSLNYGGGLILVTKPGAPGICQIDRIPISPDYVAVIGYFPSLIPKKSILSSPEKKKEINGYGRKALEAILADPSLENFLNSCWTFAEKAGFTNDSIRALVKAAKKAGAVGAAQNMIGEAVHAIAHEEDASSVAEAFKQTLPKEQVIISRVDFQGARLIK
jgi:pantoate kinase